MPRQNPRGGPGRPLDERGIGLFEVIAGTLVATVAVLGLAYSFGIGRGLIDRYEVARCALGEAQRIVDSLAVQPSANLVPGSVPFVADGVTVGTTSWTIDWVDDPVDGLASGSPPDPDPNDLKRIVVTVSWQIGTSHDDLGLTRIVPGK
jgi:hypothetical protein